MEPMKKNRKVLRASFTKAANEVTSLLEAEMKSRGEIAVAWEVLLQKYESIQQKDREIYEALLGEDATEEILTAEMDSADTYFKRFAGLRFKCEDFLQQQDDQKSKRSTGSNQSDTSEKGRRRFKLPTLQFKQFDGDIKNWLSFWGQFKKIHEDTNIDSNDKISYLIQATVPGSRARQVVESFPAMQENYVKIIKCLESCFGRKDLQVEVYVRELLKLILSSAMTNQKLDISVLYDRIETQLRALETLGITSDKSSAMLLPLIESCLPQDLLRTWQRSSSGINNSSDQTSNNETSLEVRLKNLMTFLRNEMENEQRISLASEGFGLLKNQSSDNLKSSNVHNRQKKAGISSSVAPTATELVNCNIAKCLFCTGSHDSKDCFKAQKMTHDEKKTAFIGKRACFRCLKVNHQSRNCRRRLKCPLCSKSHVVVMCPDLPINKQHSDSTNSQKCEDVLKNQALSNYTSTDVFLQTLRITLRGPNGLFMVRALIDSGSQRSYVLRSTATKLGLKSKSTEKIVHCLFGGFESINTHHCYDVLICNGNYSCIFEALDQSIICNDVSPVFYGPWTDELSSLCIDISDAQQPGPIELLLGADVAGKLYCGLIAIETYVGWTVMGKILCNNVKSNVAMTTLSLHIKSASITDLWELDILGIQEPTEKKNKEEMAMAAKELFLQTLNVNSEGRYEVRLPWLDGHPPLPTNYNVAKKRLNSAVCKLKSDGILERYDKVFRDWESEGIIEKTDNFVVQGHYLPHQPVIKENSTTQIRPVFDGSAREKDKPSLNQCLEKGQNLIELIPSLLLRFRENQIGVISDIRKAFLQISIHEKDRDFLRFLWVDDQGKDIVFRHRRVVFGVNSSPFLLGATIEYHLTQCLEKCSSSGATYSRSTVERLKKSFYVDNCVTSVPDQETLNKFINESILIMAEGKFDLRGWEFSQNIGSDNDYVSVLDLNWFPKRDVLTINQQFLKDDDDYTDATIVTKRQVLSMAQRVFDPIGFTCPTTLIPKLLLQRLWEKQLTWDTPIDNDTV